MRVNHEYQRGLVWTQRQKKLFIDSIFRGYPIPAFYFQKTQIEAPGITNTFFDVIDGQKRIQAIYTFSENEFKLIDPISENEFDFPNFMKNYPCDWGGKRFDGLASPSLTSTDVSL